MTQGGNPRTGEHSRFRIKRPYEVVVAVSFGHMFDEILVMEAKSFSAAENKTRSVV